ncbi:hypothetical protein AAVH_09477 [Aphelenchoides avenae]|nr:hypothetical protein AAVH_09477 [Aphelenchus avenae]
MVSAAYFYDVPVAQSYMTAYIARKTDGMNVHDLRSFLGTEDDFTPEDYAEMAENPRLRKIIEKDGLMPLMPGTSGENAIEYQPEPADGGENVMLRKILEKDAIVASRNGARKMIEY